MEQKLQNKNKFNMVNGEGRDLLVAGRVAFWASCCEDGVSEAYNSVRSGQADVGLGTPWNFACSNTDAAAG